MSLRQISLKCNYMYDVNILAINYFQKNGQNTCTLQYCNTCNYDVDASVYIFANKIIRYNAIYIYSLHLVKIQRYVVQYAWSSILYSFIQYEHLISKFQIYLSVLHRTSARNVLSIMYGTTCKQNIKYQHIFTKKMSIQKQHSVVFSVK